MHCPKNHHRQQSTDSSRQGAATVEFALVAPLFLILILGVAEYGTAINAYNIITSAVREGGRLASMDFSGYVTASQTANDKVIRDIRAFITASGLPGNAMEIAITDAETGGPFELSDPDNYLRYFRISVRVPYKDVSSFPLAYMDDHHINTSMVFRRGRVQIVQ